MSAKVGHYNVAADELREREEEFFPEGDVADVRGNDDFNLGDELKVVSGEGLVEQCNDRQVVPLPPPANADEPSDGEPPGAEVAN